MAEIVLFSPGGATAAKQDNLINLIGGTLKVDDDQAQVILQQIIDRLNATLKVDDDQAQVLLQVIVDRLTATLQVDDEEARGFLATIASRISNNLPTIDAPMKPTSGSTTGTVTDLIVVAPAPGMRLRLRRFHLHMDPEAAAGTFNTVTMKMGATVLFNDKFEPGLPFAEGLVVEGIVNQTITLTTSSPSKIFYNLRTEEF